VYSDDSRPTSDVERGELPGLRADGNRVLAISVSPHLSWTQRITGIALIAGLFFIRFGYDFGLSDQDEFLPYLLHLFRPDLLLSDWFVNTQTAAFSIRTPFVYVLYGPALLFSIKTAVLIVYILSFYLTASSVLDLVYRATRNVWLSWLGGILILVVTHQWQPGGNEILNRMLVPSMLAWGIALKSIVSFERRRIVYSVVGLAMATWIHPLVGLQISFLLFSTILVVGVNPLVDNRIRTSQAVWRQAARLPPRWNHAAWSQSTWNRIRSVYRPIVVYAVLVAPLFWILLVQQSADRTDAASAYRILTQVRSPHHYIPGYFPTATWIRFGLIVVGALLMGLWYAGKHIDTHRLVRTDRSFRVMIVLSVICLMVLVVAMSGSVLIETPLVVKLQLFKVGIVLKSISIVLIILGLISLLPSRFRDRWDRSNPDGWILAAASSAVLILLIFVSSSDLVGSQRMAPGRSPFRRATDEMMRWVRAETAESSRFVVPPGMTGFRYGAERAIFVNFKAVPYAPRDLLEWYRRMTVLSPDADVKPGGSAYLRAAEARFQERSIESTAKLMTHTHTTFMVRRSDYTDESPLIRPVFSNEAWWIFELNTSNESTIE